MSRFAGPVLSLREAAAYIGWAHGTLRNQWKRHPLLVAGAIKCGRKVTFYVSALDSHNRAHRVQVGDAVRA